MSLWSFILGVPVGVAFTLAVLLMGGLLPADTGDGLPDAEAGQTAVDEAPPEPTWPTIQDADPADWYECMDRAFELSNFKYLIHDNGTAILTDERRFWTESTAPVANTMWYIAVCDRLFPVNAP